jgi:hypothetical protein
MLRRDVLSLGMLLTAGGLASTLPGVADAAPKRRGNGLLAKGVAGTWTGKGGASGALTADVLIKRITGDRQTRTLKVHGLISSAGGNAPSFANRHFVATATLTGQGAQGGRAVPQQTCTILTLDIGAIHLDLLGLVIDLAPIHLNVTAQSGPGRLLGNLLCTLANLLNANPLNLTRIQQVLGRINQILQTALVIISGL